jgi:hypothetical protein
LPPVHATVEWCGQAPEPNCGSNRGCPAQTEGHAGDLLGRGSDDHHSPAQPIIGQERRQDPL